LESKKSDKLKNFKKNGIYIVIAVLVLIILVGGVYLLVKKTNSKNTQTASNSQNGGQNSFRRGGGNFANRGNFKPITGTISSISGQTIVLKVSDGTTKNIDCSNARISEFSNGSRTQLSMSDLTVNETINVMGDSTQNPIQARMIIVGTMPTFQPGNSNNSSNNSTNNSGSLN
jgi:hypothetical protein